MRNPFKDMAENAKAQHEVDKANFEAVKAQSRANWEEAKLLNRERQALANEEREEELAEAKKLTAEANERIVRAKKLQEEYRNED